MNEAGADGLRRLFRERAVGEPAPGECPTPEQIWAAALDEAAQDEFRRVLDHTAACPACAAAWRLARDYERPAAVSEPSRTWGTWASLGAAAVIVLGVGLLLVAPWQEPPGEPAFRARQVDSIRSKIDEGVRLQRSSCVLRWEFDVEGALFSIRVLDEDLEMLTTAINLPTAEFHVPEDALEPLGAGAKILWQVDALLPDGSRSRSPTFVARIE